MACGVAVKRSLELDSLLSPDSSLKRRRTSINASHCVPFRPAFANSPPHHQQTPQNVELQQSSSNAVAANQNQNQNQTPSSFVNVQPKISSEELESYLMSEIHSLRRRRTHPNRQVGMDDGVVYGDRSPPQLQGSDSDSEQHMDSVSPQSSPHRATSSMQLSPSLIQSDRPLFTYKQVRLICERLLKEQEVRLREEYDQLLNARLAEQYDTFVRFTYDQIHRRIDDSPMSYLS